MGRIKANNPGRPIPDDRVMGFATAAEVDEYLAANPDTVISAVHFNKLSDTEIHFGIQTNSTLKVNGALCASAPHLVLPWRRSCCPCCVTPHRSRAPPMVCGVSCPPSHVGEKVVFHARALRARSISRATSRTPTSSCVSPCKTPCIERSPASSSRAVLASRQPTRLSGTSRSQSSRIQHSRWIRSRAPSRRFSYSRPPCSDLSFRSSR